MTIHLRFEESYIPIRIDLAPWLEAYGLDITTRTDAIWLIKAAGTDGDDAALYQGTELGGIAFSGTTALLYVTDWIALPAELLCRFGLGLKFPGDARFREIPLDDNSLYIEPDFIRA